MEPNQINAAMDRVKGREDVAQALAGQVHTILEFYKDGVDNLLADPSRYGVDFKMLSYQKKHNQEKAFRRLALSLLEAAKQSVLVAEEFHMNSHIVISEKVARGSIPGVMTPSLAPDMKQGCVCGHAYGMHSKGEDGPCMDMDCPCKEFTQYPKEVK